MHVSHAIRLGLLVLALALPGCAVARAQQAPAQGTPVVDVAALMRVHPFAPLLAQYDREIEALGSTALTAGSAETAGAVRAAQSGFARERAESALVNGRLRAHAAEYLKSENDQLAALAATPVAPARVRSALDATYREQAADVRERAATSFAQYRAALAHQRTDALGALRTSLDASLRRSYAADVQRVTERESDDYVALVAKTAAERLNLRLLLRNAGRHDTTRQTILDRLAALDEHQQDAIAAERTLQARALAQRQAALRAHYNAEFARLAGDLDAKIAANAGERRAVFAAQANPPKLAGLNEPAQSDVDIDAEARDFHANAPALGKDDVTPALQAPDDEVKANIRRRQAADRDSRGRTNAEIDALRRDRAALVKAMRAQILRLARQDAGAGDTDVTLAVRAQLKALSL